MLRRSTSGTFRKLLLWSVAVALSSTRALERMGVETSHCPSETCDALQPPKILKRRHGQCQTVVSLATVFKHHLLCLFMDEEVDELGEFRRSWN